MVELKVEDMGSHHCQAIVTEVLKTVDPQAKLEIDLVGRRVRVQSTRAVNELTDALAEAGYPAVPMQANG